MVTPTPLRTAAEEALIRRFPAERDSLPGTSAVQGLRSAAFERFAAAGLPHRRVEAWRYTDLRSTLRTIAPAAGPADSARIAGAATFIPGDTTRRIVFGNGRLIAELSDLANLEPGLSIVSLADALAAGDALALGGLEDRGDADGNVALQLNLAFVTDGLVIDIAPGAEIARPIEIAIVSDGADAVSTALRHVIRVGAGAKATVIETVSSTMPAAHQSNVVTVIDVADGAELTHVRLQLEPTEALALSTVVAEIGSKARFETFNAALGGAIARAQIFARFAGREAFGGLRGVTLLGGRRHADTTLVVRHDAEACESRELFKAIVDDEARSVFQGRINVPAHAQKTDARMRADALLLSEAAEANAKPELEIFADDVQCGHGATCGALDDGLLFYLLARGISKTEAEKMLILAFLGEAIDAVGNEAVRQALLDHVDGWLSARG